MTAWDLICPVLAGVLIGVIVIVAVEALRK